MERPQHAGARSWKGARQRGMVKGAGWRRDGLPIRPTGARAAMFDSGSHREGVEVVLTWCYGDFGTRLS